MGCGVQMGAFRWVTSNDPKVVVGPPFRTIVDHGIQVGIHGDGVHIAPLNPWSHIAYAVTGLDSFGNQVNAGQQLTRAEVLKIFTYGNSWFLRMEDKIGTLETGKLADLVVLDRDYLTIPADQIKDIKPVMTVVGGKVVYEVGSRR
jgi:predicted amidohydrolase YtcJ